MNRKSLGRNTFKKTKEKQQQMNLKKKTKTKKPTTEI